MILKTKTQEKSLESEKNEIFKNNEYFGKNIQKNS